MLSAKRSNVLAGAGFMEVLHSSFRQRLSASGDAAPPSRDRHLRATAAGCSSHPTTTATDDSLTSQLLVLAAAPVFGV